MSTAGASPEVPSQRQNGWTSNTPRADGERHEPTPKSSNSLSSSRRKLSSGRQSAGRLFSFSSAFPGNLVVSSAMALSPDRTETPSKASNPCGLARSFDGGKLFAMTRLTSPRLCGLTGEVVFDDALGRSPVTTYRASSIHAPDAPHRFHHRSKGSIATTLWTRCVPATDGSLSETWRPRIGRMLRPPLGQTELTQ